MIHYAVAVNGKVIGSRSSKSHAVQIYTHALVSTRADSTVGVVSYHGSQPLAEKARQYWGRHLQGALSIMPVTVTAKRAKVGDMVVPQGVL